jgi:hypothetical protein
MTSHEILNPNQVSPIKQLILGLENLEALCLLGGGQSERLSWSWMAQPKRKHEDMMEDVLENGGGRGEVGSGPRFKGF